MPSFAQSPKDIPDSVQQGSSAAERATALLADLVLLPSESDAMAVAEIARPLWGMKAGRLSFERPAERLFPPGQ